MERLNHRISVMKTNLTKAPFSFAVAALLAASVLPVAADEAQQKALAAELPQDLLIGTPKDQVRKHPGLRNDEPQVLVPAASAVISRGKTVTSSDKEIPFEGDLFWLTDGEKEGHEGYSVIIAEGPQWVQVDLGEARLVDAVVVWHYFRNLRVVNDVIVQASEDQDFKTGVTTLFNNDTDNSSKQGVGTDAPFIGTFKGKQISGKGTKARYIRCWSNGNTDHKMNEFIEVEVWGRPVK